MATYFLIVMSFSWSSSVAKEKLWVHVSENNQHIEH
jgi:hypothetical protein